MTWRPAPFFRQVALHCKVTVGDTPIRAEEMSMCNVVTEALVVTNAVREPADRGATEPPIVVPRTFGKLIGPGNTSEREPRATGSRT